jgi:hypothetical protein
MDEKGNCVWIPAWVKKLFYPPGIALSLIFSGCWETDL